jgi:hypothetical protein
MRYVASHTSISVLRVIHYRVEVDGDGFGSPYMINDYGRWSDNYYVRLLAFLVSLRTILC